MVTSALHDTGLSTADIEKIISVFNSYNQIERALLYGSRAKGNFKPYSDIDLTLFGPELTLTLLNSIENDLEDLLLPNKIDLCIYHNITNKDLTAHIDRMGKQFYKKE